MISLNVILITIISHWIFDFLFQTDYMGNNKSKDIFALLSHTMVYSVLWLIPMTLLLGLEKAVAFAGITFLIHTLTDYFTSKLTHKLYNYNLIRLFFNVIGGDQVLHYIQLFFTYYLLTK